MTLTGNLRVKGNLQLLNNLTGNLMLVGNLENQVFDKSDRVSDQVKRSPFSPRPATD